MEVVGGVASVIAIVDLTAKIAKLCAGYINEAKDCESEITALKNRVQALGNVLEELGRLLKGPHQNKLKASQKLQDSLSDCKNELLSLEKRLESGSTVAESQSGPSNSHSKGLRKLFNPLKKVARGTTVSNVVRILVWPIEKAEVEKIMMRFEKMEAVIQFALQIDQTQVVLDVDVKLNLINLPVAEGASFGWHEDEHEPRCLPNTREELLEEIDKWATGPPGKHIYWLSGAAGTGKSTIARTVAETYQKAGLLGASFFFRRGAGDRAKASKFFTTLATNLMQHIPGTRIGVSNAIELEPDIPRRILKEQFEKLIFEPISLSKHEGRIIFVIDALDECDDEQDVLTIVKLLGLMKNLKAADVRIFITSRREVFIKAGFQRISGDFQDLVLHDIEERKILHDITVFLEHELTRIKADHAYSDTLPTEWPAQSIIDDLAKMACPLFIVASTICRFIEDPETLPGEQLAEILEKQHKLLEANPERSLRLTYLQIINQRVKNKTSSQLSCMLKEFQVIVGTVILLETPLSRTSLSQLIDVEDSKIRLRLDGFQSVLNLPESSDGEIKAFHLSFREFLLDPQTKEESALWIDELQVHSYIAERCIVVMRKHLRKNICNLASPAHRQGDITPDIIQNQFPPELRYACKYWVHHLLKCGRSIRDGGEAHKFLEDCTLEWLEATSILRINFDTIDAILALESITNNDRGIELSKVLYDIRRFIRYNYEIIDETPLQVYYSALLFSPQNCLLRQKYYPRYLSWVENGPQVDKDWGRLLQSFAAYPISETRYITFSPNGENLSVFDSYGSRTWNIKTGALIKADPNVTSPLIYSPNGVWMAAWEKDAEIVILDVTTGIEMIRLDQSSEDNIWRCLPIGFSHDSKYFVSMIGYGTFDPYNVSFNLLLWDTETWRIIHSFGSLRPCDAIFSRDDSLIVSWSIGTPEEGIRLWDVKSGDLLQHMTVCLYNLEVSPNGECLLYYDGQSFVILRLNSRQLDLVYKFPPSGCYLGQNHLVFLSDDEIAGFTSTSTESSGPPYEISVWCVRSRSFVRTIKGTETENYPHSMTLSPDCRTLIIETDRRPSFLLWDLSPTALPEEDQNKDIDTKLLKAQVPRMVRFVSISVNCDFLASGDDSGSEITIWRLLSGKYIFHSRLQFGKDEDFHIDGEDNKEDDDAASTVTSPGIFSWDNKFFAATDQYSKKLRAWRIDNGDIACGYNCCGRYFRIDPLRSVSPDARLAFSQDNRLLAASFSALGPNLVFELESHAAPIKLIHTDAESITCRWLEFIAFSSDNSTLALVEPSKTELWCTRRWLAIKTIEQGLEPKLQIVDPTYRYSFNPLLRKLGGIWTINYEEESVNKELHFNLNGPSGIDRDVGASYGAWEEGWVVQNGVRVLWVPHGFRGNKAPETANWQVRGDIIVVGNSNRIDLFKFKSQIA